MKASKFVKIDIHFLEQWFANVVDTFNYNMDKIETEVPALAQELTTLDAVPISDIRTWFGDFIKQLNVMMDEMITRMDELEARLDAKEEK